MARGSRKTVVASLNEIPCLSRFAAAFPVLHSYTTLLQFSSHNDSTSFRWNQRGEGNIL
jgi:hypothetical protein